ncbi:MAG: hypothetical protein IJS70_02190 [Bacteroidales bacterium]|nr:hypothetical protein [Bacteroidales bacterium]MBQ6081509.1 hypothetical protein [Bacteroidales bacterium]MBQ7457959.1 hypothetical protein [Bacteroidales bacterium]
MRRLILTMMLLAACVAGRAQEGNPATRLSRDTILIGDQIEWIIPLEMAPGEKYFLEDIADPPAPGVEIIKPLQLDTVSNGRKSVKVEGKVILTSFDSGSYYLPPLIAMIERGSGVVDTLYMEGPTLEVTTVPIDTATYVIKDLKGQIKYPLKFKELLPWIGLALLLALIVWALVRWITMSRANRTFLGKPIVKDPPHIVALRALDKIRKQKLWQNDKQKQFYTEVTDALRVYIADRYGIVALERPSREMLADLKKQDIEEALYGKMDELFTRADLVKFAKYLASAEENEEVIPDAVRFVNATYIKEIDEEKKEEK